MQNQTQGSRASRGSQGVSPSGTVMQYKNDPNIYLYVMGEWYCYNPYLPPLGGGAMGTVYRGVCCSNGAPVAVKRVIDNYANNPQIRARAKLEASLAFRHPNLVEMVGYCEYAPNYGPIFLISNFVQGEDIDKYVQGFDNLPDRVEKISLAICSVLDALDYIHHVKIYVEPNVVQEGLVHRDIKPSNIMVEDGHNVRLMDLGIAKMNGGNPYSQFGFIGTPEYAAPEQVRGDKDGVNVTTDIYQVGITFYELLAGTNPMACSTEVETLTKQLKEPLPSNSKIPRKMMDVILKATEKAQFDRYQTALQFKDAIQDALLPDPTLWERFCKWVRENLLLFVLVTILLIGVVVAVILLLIGNL